MSLGRAIATIAGCTMLLAAIGGTVGFGLGKLVPEYYRSVFSSGHEPKFDPVSVGVGQGLTQGTAGGVVVGLAIVAIFCWREIRLHDSAATSPVGNVLRRVPVRARRVLYVTVSALALCFCLCSGVVLGLLGGEQRAYQRQFQQDQEAITPMLNSDPAYAGIEMRESVGRVYLSGEVPTAEDRDRLRERVIKAVGERRAREAMLFVRIRGGY